MSVIYEIRCKQCGNLLTHQARLDGDEDLLATVEPCGVCIKAAVDEAETKWDEEEA